MWNSMEIGCSNPVTAILRPRLHFPFISRTHDPIISFQSSLIVGGSQDAGPGGRRISDVIPSTLGPPGLSDHRFIRHLN